MDFGGDAAHAEEPLPHHDALYARSGDARPRHDVPHRHRAGEPRFFQRNRHGGEAPRRSGAAACDHRAVRQLAVHRGQAERFFVGAFGDLAPYRRRPAAACCRSPSRPAWGSSAMSTMRSTCRCISSSAARSITTSRAPAFEICSTGGWRRCPASAPAYRTGPITSRPFSPRCGSSDISRCAAPMSGRPIASRRCRR